MTRSDGLSLLVPSPGPSPSQVWSNYREKVISSLPLADGKPGGRGMGAVALWPGVGVTDLSMWSMETEASVIPSPGRSCGCEGHAQAWHRELTGARRPICLAECPHCVPRVAGLEGTCFLWGFGWSQMRGPPCLASLFSQFAERLLSGAGLPGGQQGEKAFGSSCKLEPLSVFSSLPRGQRCPVQDW